MFLFVILPFTACLANQPNESQSDDSTPTQLPQQDFIVLSPTKPTFKWPRYTHNPFYRPSWRPPSPYGHQHYQLASTPSFNYFPEWIPSKRSPSFPHYHPQYHFPRQQQHHHHHHDLHHHSPSTEMTPIQLLLNTPFEREDELKSPNATETIELDSQIFGSMEKLLTAPNLQAKVEILKSIEMEYDPVLKRFVQKKSEIPQPKHKKRSGEIGLFTPQTHQNLHDVFKKFEQEQMNEALIMREKKNFQTGRFKFKNDLKINKPSNNNSIKNLLELICNIKQSEPKDNVIAESSDRFSRNANFYPSGNSGSTRKENHFYAEPDLNNNSINVYVDDPNFFNFLQGNWSKGGIPIMLTAMSMNKSEDCDPG